MNPGWRRPTPGIGAGPGRWRAAVASLEHRQYRWLFASNMAFFLAMQGQMLVRSMITFELTSSPLDLGFVNFAVAIPMMIMSPFGGVVADRFERRRLIMLGQGALILSELLVVALLVTGQLQFWHLVATAIIMGCVFPFTMPARMAIVVNIIGKRGLQNAMALSMGGMNATRILGPTLSGFLVPILGLSGAFSIGIVLYVIALLCLLGVHRCPPLQGARDLSVGRDLAEGFRYIGANRLVLVLLAFGILPMFLAMPFQTLLVVFTEDVWAVGSRGLGLLYAVSGLGGLLGSIYVAQRAETSGRLGVMLGALVGFASFLLAFAMSPWFLLALPLVLAANVFSSVFGTLNNTAIQILIPDRVRGRVSSFLMMSFGITPLGTLPMAAVAESFGAPVAVAGASVLVIAVGLLFYASSPSLRSVDARTREALENEDLEQT
ncbi:MAG: MFS transporter [Proteobacteria bacterium]|nr:MFS transporter [Pseudomonadota bacterium]